MLIYVDDIIVPGNNPKRVQEFIDILGRKFSLKDLGALSYFLGIEAQLSALGLLLTQRKYINDLLSKCNMTTANPASSPMVSDRLQLTSEQLLMMPLSTEWWLAVCSIYTSRAQTLLLL